MKIGTKSLLFGVHQFAIHPWFVALAWRRLYGFPWDPRLWVSFFVHDLGYWGKPNMDGPEGETHPFTGAAVMGALFDHLDRYGHRLPLQPWFTQFTGGVCDLIWGRCPQGQTWYCFTLYHSRYLAKRYGVGYSPLCVADKLGTALPPQWLYLLQANLTGEIWEYMNGSGARTPAGERTQRQWLAAVQRYCREWAYVHRDGRSDGWTGTRRDLAIDAEHNA
jgi:hypothetical protein